MDKVCSLAQRCAHFALIYIKEAHAEDTWPLGLADKTLQTHTTESRLENARRLLVKYPEFPDAAQVLVDEAPGNEFDELFAAWPLRFYVIDKGAVSFIGEPHGDLMLLDDLEKYLDLRGL